MNGVCAAVEGGISAARAAESIEQFRAAETYQWEIGTWSTGSGEGLSSMRAVRELQIAQAWLWAARAPDDPDAGTQARKLLDEAADDPNRVAVAYSARMRALHDRLMRK